MLRQEKSSGKSLRTLFIAALTTGSFMALADDSQAQLRTGRGTRQPYSSGNSNATNTARPTSNEARSQVELASANQASTVKPSATNRPNAATRASSVSSAKTTSADSQVVQAGCTSCQSGNEAATETYESDGVVMDTGMGCDTCGGATGSCDCCTGEMYNGGPIVVDLGCGPLANIVGWLNRKSYVRFQAASFDQNGMDLPILATQGTGTGTVPGTPVAFGNNEVNTDTRIGYRFQAGIWLDDCFQRAIEVRGFDTGTWSTNFSEDNVTTPVGQVLVRPVSIGGVQTPTVSVGTGVVGAIRSTATSEAYGGDILMRRRLMQTNCIRWDLLMGYQGTRVYDDLTIYSSSGPSPATIEIQDSFFTRNKFDGMTMGFGRFSRFGYMSIDTRFKLGMGNLRRQVIIQGTQTVNTNTVRPNEGLLARATNSGTFNDDSFVVSPEFSLDAGFSLTRNLDFVVGYNFLALPKVARAGDQIQVDASNIPITDVSTSTSGPTFNLVTQSYWLQSLNFGAQWKY